MATADLPVIGMTCSNCAAAVERALMKKVPGVRSAVVNLAEERVHITYDPEVAGLDEMSAAVERAGYRLVLPADGEAEAEAERAAREKNVRRSTGIFHGGRFHAASLYPEHGEGFRAARNVGACAMVRCLLFALATRCSSTPGGVSMSGIHKHTQPCREHGCARRARLLHRLCLFYRNPPLPRSGRAWILRDLGAHHNAHQTREIPRSQSKKPHLPGDPCAHGTRPPTAHVEENGVEQVIPADRVPKGAVAVVRPGERIPVDGVVVSGESPWTRA